MNIKDAEMVPFMKAIEKAEEQIQKVLNQEGLEDIKNFIQKDCNIKNSCIQKDFINEFETEQRVLIGCLDLMISHLNLIDMHRNPETRGVNFNTKIAIASIKEIYNAYDCGLTMFLNTTNIIKKNICKKLI